DDRPRHDHEAGGPWWPGRSEGSGRLDDHVPLVPGPRVDVESFTVESSQRVPEPLRGVEPHPPLQAAGVHRASRFHPDRMPAGRLSAAAVRGRPAVEERHAGDGPPLIEEANPLGVVPLAEPRDETPAAPALFATMHPLRRYQSLAAFGCAGSSLRGPR